MATKSALYGRLLTLKIGGVQIDNLLTNSLSQTRDTRDVTTKDSEDWEESQPTIRRKTIDFTGLTSQAATTGYVELQNAYDNGTTGTWKYGTGLAGAKYWSGSGHIVKLDFQAPHDGNVEFSGSVKLTGVITFGTD